MPIITELELADRGRRRRAEFILRGNLVWQPGDVSRNGAEILTTFFGQDAGTDDLIWNYVVWVAKGRTFREELDDSAWVITAEDASLSRFELTTENNSALFPGRRFNEDIPGRDEVYAIARLRDSDGSALSAAVRSNTVRGRY